MTTVPRVVDEAEQFVRQLATELTRVREGECLCCYVVRQLADYQCDGTHRHALRYRDSSAPRATALRERLCRLGACCCDCELFLNGYEPRPDPSTAEPPRRLALCAGVRRGSVRPCRNWVRMRPR
jgi:uncharacterized protein DUF2695